MELLYVDDEPSLLELGKEFLELESDVSVTIQTCPVKALAMLGDRHFDLIVSDYMMPEMDGLEFFKRLRTTGNATPFILFTGKGREEVVIEAMRHGVDFYIKKGGDAKSQFAELINAIRQCTARKEAEEALEHNAMRFRTMIENQSEIIAISDLNGNVTYISNSVKRILGYDPEQVIGKKVISFFEDPNLLDPVSNLNLLALIPDMTFKLEAGLRHIDGSVRQIEMSGRILTREGVPFEVVVNGYDITGRMQDERRIAHLINVLKAIRQVSKAIKTETEPMRLLRSVCDIAVERGYSTAWAIIFDDGRNPARMVEAGIGKAFEEVRSDYSKGKRLPCTGQVFTGKDIFVNHDPQLTCPDCPLNGFPLHHIHVAKPLSYAGHIFGQLSVTLPTELFSPDELSVLGDIAEDLSSALHHLLQGQERDEHMLSMVKMKKIFHERFTQMSRPTFVADRVGIMNGVGHRLTVKGASNAFLDAMGFDGSLGGMDVGALAETITDGAELVRVIDEVVRSKIPQSVSIRSARTEMDYMAFVFAPGADYAGVMLIPSAKAERSLRIGRAA